MHIDLPYYQLLWVNWVWVRVSGAVNDNVIRHPSAALARGTLITFIAISGYYNLCELSGSEREAKEQETFTAYTYIVYRVCRAEDKEERERERYVRNLWQSLSSTGEII